MSDKGRRTRELIKSKAHRLFADNGFKSVTMKDLCEATGLSRGGLYRHYESTVQIFEEMMSDMLEVQEEEFTDKMKKGISAVQILDEVLERYRIEMTDHNNSLSIALVEYYSDKQEVTANELLLQQLKESERMWCELIEYGMERGEFKAVNARAVFSVIVYAYQGIRLFGKVLPVESDRIREMTEQFREMLVERSW